MRFILRFTEIMESKIFLFVFTVCLMTSLIFPACEGAPSLDILIPRNRYANLRSKMQSQTKNPNTWTSQKYLKWRVMYGKRSDSDQL